MGKVRDHHFDNIKAILIFLVVLGHVLKKYGTTTEAAIMYKIIFSFHMPAFLFVSGYFARVNPKKVFSKLFPLYILFQLLQCFETSFLPLVFTGNWKPFHVDFFTPMWTLWYLVALMMYQLLLPIFDTDKLKRQAGFLILACALGLAIGLTPDTNNFMALSRVFAFLPFFLLGYYEKQSRFLQDVLKNKRPVVAKIIAAIAGVILITCFILFHEHISAKNFFGSEPYTDISSMWWRILGWIISFVWVMILIIWTPERSLGYIGTIGSNTLPIYLFHSLALLILVKTPLAQLINGNIFGIILLSAVLTFVLSWNGFEKILRKIQIPVKHT